MENNEINNNCIQCAYCVKHYANLRGTYYLVNGCIHCINENLSVRESNKRIKNIVKCNFWQPRQIQAIQRRNSIIELLYDIANKLTDVAQILEEDHKE